MCIKAAAKVRHFSESAKCFASFLAWWPIESTQQDDSMGYPYSPITFFPLTIYRPLVGMATRMPLRL